MRCGRRGHGRGASLVASALALVLAVACLAVACVAVPADAATGPVLRISERRIDFGKVPQLQQFHHALKVRNVGDAPLRILKVETSCGCTAAVPADSVVPPGREVTIDVAFSSREFEGLQEKSIKIRTNDPAEPLVSVTVTADVKPYVRMDPTVIRFPKVRLGQAAFEKVRFTAEKAYGLAIGKIDGGEGRLLITTEREKGVDGEDAYVMTVKLRPDAPAGPFRTMVQIDTKGKVSRNFNLMVTGEVVSYFSVESDPRIRIPTTTAGKSVSMRIPVTCDGTKPYRLTGVETSLPFLTGEVVPKGKDYEVVLTVGATAPADQYKGSVKIKTSDPAQPVIELVVQGYVRR